MPYGTLSKSVDLVYCQAPGPLLGPGQGPGQGQGLGQGPGQCP